VRSSLRLVAFALAAELLAACAVSPPARTTPTPQAAQSNSTPTPQAAKLSLADFSFLQLGMAYEDIQARVGDADEQIGSGITNYVYYLNDGSELSLTFYPEDVLFSVSRYDPETHRREMIIAPVQ
jgi:hypothetical protein